APTGFCLAAFKAFDSRDLVRAAALRGITPWAAALSRFLAATRSSVRPFSRSPAVTAVRTLRTSVLRAYFVARLRTRRPMLCFSRFFALLVFGMEIGRYASGTGQRNNT